MEGMSPKSWRRCYTRPCRTPTRRYAGHRPQAVSASAAWSRDVRRCTYYLYRTLRNLDPMDLERLMEERRTRRRRHATRGRLARDEYEDRIDKMKKRSRRRSAVGWWRTGRRGDGQDAAQAASERSTSCTRQRRADDAAPGDLPVTRQLACGWLGSVVTVARVRSTSATPCATRCLRGVPAEPKFKYPRPAKPEIVVIADISGSVRRRPLSRCSSSTPSPRSLEGALVRLIAASTGHSYFEGVEDVWRRCIASTPKPTSSGSMGTPTTATPSRRSGEVGQGDNKKSTVIPRRCAEQYHARRPGDQGDRAAGPPRLLAEPRAEGLLGHRRLDRQRYSAHCNGVFECRNLKQSRESSSSSSPSCSRGGRKPPVAIGPQLLGVMRIGTCPARPSPLGTRPNTSALRDYAEV